MLLSQIAREFSRRARLDRSKRTLANFKKMHQEWLGSTVFDPTVCGGEGEEASGRGA